MIKITQGDDATLDLTAAVAGGARLDLTSASFSTTVLGAQGVALVYPNSQHTADPDQVNNRGKFILSLASADTLLIPACPNKDIVTKITIGGQITYFRGNGILNVYPTKPTK